MTLEEAIRLLEADTNRGHSKQYQEFIKAERLGIAALKRCNEARTKVYFTTRSLLPGETKESTTAPDG
jgi:hypothetical protein